MVHGFSIIFQTFIEVLLILFYFPAGLFNTIFLQSQQHLTTKRKGTIVLVERWLHSNILHNKWKRYLEEKGYRVYMINLPLQDGTFEQSAQKLRDFIESKHAEDITLVGISNGGLTAFLYLQHFDGWKRVKQFISIGTPFRGTFASVFLSFLGSGRELLPTSSFMRSVAKENVMNKEKITCIRAAFDGLVPRSSSNLPNTENIIVDVYGHNNLHLRCKKTYDILLEKAG